MIYGAIQNNGETTLVHIEARTTGKRATVAGLSEHASSEMQMRLDAAGLTGHATVHGGAQLASGKGGSTVALDLPVAAALALVAAPSTPVPENMVLHGELAFVGGEVRQVRGSIGAARVAARAGLPFYTAENAARACAAFDLPARAVRNFVHARSLEEWPAHGALKLDRTEPLSFADVTHPLAQKALMVAAVTRRSLLFVGMPGSGRTLFSRRLRDILPPTTDNVQLDIAERTDAAGLEVTLGRPFRAPHHTCSSAALGGRDGRLGEVAIAGGGVLFLDDVPEFMREPWEALLSALRVARAKPWLVGAATPCACAAPKCQCMPSGRETWAARLAERARNFDMVVPLAKCAPVPGISTEEALDRVEFACAKYALLPEGTLGGVLLTAHVLALLDGRIAGTTVDVAEAVELHVAITPRGVS